MLYTIGYGGREDPVNDFLTILKRHRIRVLADIRAEPIRLRPFRKGGWPTFSYAPPKPGIREFLQEHGISYLWLQELGNPYRKQDRFMIKFAALMEQRGSELTERLRAIDQTVCILCACKDYRNCHRKIVADYLKANYRYQIAHL